MNVKQLAEVHNDDIVDGVMFLRAEPRIFLSAPYQSLTLCAYAKRKSMPFADPPAPPSPKSPRPTLLTLPLELRLKIFTLALLPSHRPSPTSRSPFSLLLTCRAIHHTTRHLPTELYPITFAYDSSRPHLSQLLPAPLRHEWQIAHLRRLAITWLYPSQLPVFLGLKKNEEEEKKKKKVIAAESGGGGKLNDEVNTPPAGGNAAGDDDNGTD